MRVLVLNCGSSSLKFQLIETSTEQIAGGTDKLLAKGNYERLGSQSLISLSAGSAPTVRHAAPLQDHGAAIQHLCKWLVGDAAQETGVKSLADIHAVGHRVVHGGEKFSESVLITASVRQGIEDCIELAPLHNPANLQGIKAITELLGPALPQVAVFDTAFHTSMPEQAYLYALPYQFYRRYKIRRYGFHGTSHRYVSYRYRLLTNKPKEQVKVISLHLGNGCSACAISGGKSVDTSMGMTPLEGLVMGTRSGDLDPAIAEYLALREGLTGHQLDAVFNKQSGLLGVSGLTNDMRELLAEEAESGDRRARLAIDLFCSRARKYIGAYLAELGGADALLFTGGIGENAAPVRERIVKGLEWLGIELDSAKNQGMTGKEGLISSAASKVAVYVIPTNEELLIARDTFRAVTGQAAEPKGVKP